MMIPGSNLLGMAFSLIGTEEVAWHRYVKRTENELGEWVSQHLLPVPARGSVQPLDRAKYSDLGLDLAKSYFTLYTSSPIGGVDRQKAPDLVDYNGRRHEVVDVLDWTSLDGWRSVLLIDIGPVP